MDAWDADPVCSSAGAKVGAMTNTAAILTQSALAGVAYGIAIKGNPAPWPILLLGGLSIGAAIALSLVRR